MDKTRLYRLVVDAVKDPLVLARPNGAVLLTNAAADAFFNEEGRHNVSTLRRDDSPIDGGAIRDMMARHEAVRDFAVTDASGRPSGTRLNIEPVRPEGGEELKLLHFRDQSPDVHREFWRDEMVAMVSHEIKNPLSAMKQSVDILLSGLPGELTEGQRRFLGTSGRSIERLTHLVEGILDVSRIQSGAFGVDRRRVDVRTFLADVIGSFKTLFNVRHVTLDYHVDDDPVDAYIDAAKIEQVLINLLSNALKHTPEGGEIHVTVEPAGVEAVSDDMRLLPWQELGAPRLLVIRVADTGLGMSSDTLDNVFERHYDVPGDRRGDGAHLGLNISKTLVEAQGGTVRVDSKLGIGTTVSVHVPQNRTTACLLTRMAHARDVIEGYARARRDAVLIMLGKLTDDDWDDVTRSWPVRPAVNPQPRTRVGGRFHLWTIDGSLAVAVLADHDGSVRVEDVFGGRVVTRAEGSHVLGGYAAGVCHTGEADTFVRLCSVALERMKAARQAMADAIDERHQADMDYVLNEWKHRSEETVSDG